MKTESKKSQVISLKSHTWEVNGAGIYTQSDSKASLLLLHPEKKVKFPCDHKDLAEQPNERLGVPPVSV